MSKKYTQKVHMDDLGTKVVAIGQTRGGQDEWITPMALWELDDATGLYMPPGASPDPRRPRTDTRLTDENGDLITGTNRLPVDVGGQIKADVDLGDVTVQIGEVQQGKRGQNAESWQVRAEELEQEIQELRQLLESGDTKVQLSGSNVEVLAEYQGYTGHNPNNVSTRIFGATVGSLANGRPLDVRRFGGLVLKLTNGYNVAVTHRVVAFKVGGSGPPIWVDVTEDVELPASAEFVYEIPNRYPYIALLVRALARDQTDETGLDIDIVGSVFYA